MAKPKPSTMASRRRSVRTPADWAAQYLVMGTADHSWNECRLVELSADGARLELMGPGATTGDELFIELLAIAAPDVIRLRGFVRHQSVGPAGIPHVGVEFGDHTEIGQLQLRSLLETDPGPPARRYV